MMRITINLFENEKQALKVLARREYRTPRAQAALIIRRELERCGLLVQEEKQPYSRVSQEKELETPA